MRRDHPRKKKTIAIGPLRLEGASRCRAQKWAEPQASRSTVDTGSSARCARFASWPAVELEIR